MTVLPGGLEVVPTRPEHAPALEALQRLVFPTLEEGERFKVANYLEYIEHFPDGQFVVLDGAVVVGMTSSLRLDFDFEHPWHDWDDMEEGAFLRVHRPDGRWMYGTDMGVHPGYRRRGIARALYAARHRSVRRLGMDGQVTVGMLSGFGAEKHRMGIEEYYQGVVSGRIADPTVTAQMRIGFEPRGLVADYLVDPVCEGYGVCLALPSTRDVEGSKSR